MKVRRIKNLAESDFKKKPVPKLKGAEAAEIVKKKVKEEPPKAETMEAVDEVFEGVKDEPEPVKTTEVLGVVDEDMGHFDVAAAEGEYKAAELNKEAAPIIQTTVNTEVKKAVKLNNERLKYVFIDLSFIFGLLEVGYLQVAKNNTWMKVQ